jgi:hypothetical protein
MARTSLIVTFAVGIALAPFGGQSQNQFSPKSVSVDLPPGDEMFPTGPGADAISNNCLACHSADMVLYQPALPRAQWHAEVDKMQTAFKAPVDPNDVGAILNYLSSVKGVK